MHNNSRAKKNEQGNVIWRYMSFWKFVNLISTQSLFFSRLDQFEDEAETKLPLGDFYALNSSIYSNEERERILKLNIKAVRTFYASSWISRTSESMALWKIYCPNNDGVVLKTTVNKLVSSISHFLPDEFNFKHGEVEYGNVEVHYHPRDKIFINPFLKRNPFDFEQEYRLVLRSEDINFLGPSGLPVKLKNFDFIDSVYLSPVSGKGFRRAVEAIFEQFSLAPNLYESSLDYKPNGYKFRKRLMKIPKKTNQFD